MKQVCRNKTKCDTIIQDTQCCPECSLRLREMALIIYRLCRKNPTDEDRRKYMDYLIRHNLAGSPTRMVDVPREFEEVLEKHFLDILA